MARAGWMARRCGFATAAFAATLSIGAACAAVGDEDDVPTVRVYDDWRLACPALADKAKSCELQQDVLDAEDHTELARMSIFQDNGAEQLIVTVPFNVLLDPGIGYGFDAAAPEIFQFETCNSVGCEIRIPFTGGFAERFAAAIAPRILFAGLDGKPVGLPYSMKGFAHAFKIYLREEAARGGR